MNIFSKIVPKLSDSGSKHKSQTIGSIFHITCSLEEGSFPVFFEWSRNGQTLKPNPDVNYKIENSQMFSTFTVESIDRRDIGNYSCVLRNALGFDSQSIALTIKGIVFYLIFIYHNIYV